MRLVNTSDKTITRFFLAIRDPKTQSTRGLVESRIAIKPGETFIIKREFFGGTEKVTTTDDNGKIVQKLVKPGIDSEKHWIDFAPRSDLFITVARVDFEDGSNWIIKEGGDVR